MSSEIMVQANNITKFYGEYPAISDVSFTANKGEIIGFLGPNGSGKSTLSHTLCGKDGYEVTNGCLLYTSPRPRDRG